MSSYTQKEAVFITGAARRLGREVALYLAAQGYDIALHYRNSEAEAVATAADIRALGRRCEIFQAELAEGGELPGLMTRVLEAFPRCCALINNAAIFERAPFLEAEESSLDRHMAVNLKAPILLTQSFAQAAGEGCVVNMLDVKIVETRHNYFFYLLSKKALADFTRMAAAELAPRVRVNAVALPAVMETVDGRPLKAAFAGVATPHDVAKTVHRLLCDSALTGEVVMMQ